MQLMTVCIRHTSVVEALRYSLLWTKGAVSNFGHDRVFVILERHPTSEIVNLSPLTTFVWVWLSLLRIEKWRKICRPENDKKVIVHIFITYIYVYRRTSFQLSIAWKFIHSKKLRSIINVLRIRLHSQKLTCLCLVLRYHNSTSYSLHGYYCKNCIKVSPLFIISSLLTSAINLSCKFPVHQYV